MKRIRQTILTGILSVLLCSAMLSSASAAPSVMIPNEQPTLPMRNAFANVQSVSGEEAEALLRAEEHPATVMVAVSELEDVTAFLTLCVETNTLPTLLAETPAEGETVIDAMTAAYCKDVNVISSNVPVLKNIRKNKSLIRTGLIVDLPEGELSSEQAAELRATVRSAPATFCVVSTEDASRQAVAELQQLALAVWVDVRESENTTVDVLRAVTSGANGMISADAASAASVMESFLEKGAMTRTPIMIGHRGNPSQAPENSLSGFLTAYENGADVFEIDVEITKDGEVIIMHDDTIARTTDYDGSERVNQMTLDEIRSYHLLAKDGSVSDEKVPTLREVLEEFQDKDCRIFVEFKGSNEKNVAATARLIEEYDMMDRVDVISFSNKLIQKTQAEMPGMSTGYLHSPYGSIRTYEDLLETLSTSITGAQSLKSSINPNRALINAEYLQAATERGMTVWPWTYNASGSNEAFLLCPDGITTDDVQWSKDMVKYIACENELTVGVGEALTASIRATTYGGETETLEAEALLVKVIDGDEYLTVENGVLTGVSEGQATVLFGYEAETKAGSSYAVYTQPVTVTIGGGAWLWWVIGAAVVVAAAAVVIALMLRRPKTAW